MLIISLKKKREIYFPYIIHNVYHLFEMFYRIIKIRPVLSVCRNWYLERLSLCAWPQLCEIEEELGPSSGTWGLNLLLALAALTFPQFTGSPVVLHGEVQVHKALFVWLHMPTSSCSYYRVVILICQETQNNCFYSSQWMLMHMTFWEHISGCCRGTDVHAD